MCTCKKDFIVCMFFSVCVCVRYIRVYVLDICIVMWYNHWCGCMYVLYMCSNAVCANMYVCTMQFSIMYVNVFVCNVQECMCDICIIWAYMYYRCVCHEPWIKIMCHYVMYIKNVCVCTHVPSCIIACIMYVCIMYHVCVQCTLSWLLCTCTLQQSVKQQMQ